MLVSASATVRDGAGRPRHRAATLLGLRAEVALGVEAVQAVRDVVLQPQRRHRALAEVCRVHHLRATGCMEPQSQHTTG